MKRIFIIFMFLIFGTFMGCKDMDSQYKDFIVPGGLVYVGKPNEVKAHPGKNRVLLKWLKGSDPKITYTRIYWNNYSDSIEINIDPQKENIEVLIDNLQEQNYSFFLISFDDEGNTSVPLEVITRVFGDTYEKNLLNRGLNRMEMSNDGKVSLDWGQANITAGANA